MKLKNSREAYFHRWCSFRTLTLLFIWIYLLDLNLQGYRDIAKMWGETDTFAILPFLQTDTYFTKLLLTGVLCFFSNAPFMNRSELYVVIKTGRKNWGKRNIGYIVSSSILLAVVLQVLSMLMILPTITWTNSWGSIYKTLAVRGSELGFNFSDAAMDVYTPLQLIIYVFLIDILAFTFMGMLLYTLSLYISRIGSYLVTIGCIFVTTMEAFVPFSISYYSPFSWIDLEMWRYGTSLDKPNLVYIFTAYIFVIFVLCMLAQKRICTVEWNEKEE
ncbi:MAG: hypothetical protein J6A92_05615 [Lachnospiraceae bacterium]|nr:hypothetical protein [Lachnospiraceae bacterium]